MNRRWFLLAAVIILAGAGVLIFLYARHGNELKYMTVTGIVEGVEVNLSSEISGTIVEMCCREGDLVKEGTTVIKLRNDDLMALVDETRAGIDKANAEVTVARAAIERSKANVKSADADIKNAEADVEGARAWMENAKRQPRSR